MTTTTSSSPILKGYWPEAFVPILEGTVPESESQETFSAYAQVLINHRLEGNPLADEELRLQEFQKKLIQSFHKDYLKMEEKKDLKSRLALLETLFMKTLIKVPSPKLDEDDKNFIEAVSLPGALKAKGIEREDYLKDNEIKSWLISYREACIKKKQFNIMLSLIRGYR